MTDFEFDDTVMQAAVLALLANDLPPRPQTPQAERAVEKLVSLGFACEDGEGRYVITGKGRKAARELELPVLP